MPILIEENFVKNMRGRIPLGQILGSFEFFLARRFTLLMGKSNKVLDMTRFFGSLFMS